VAVPGAIHLFINCIPVGVPTQSLAPYVDQIQAVILKNQNLPEGLDLRCVDTKPLNFGGWKGALAMAARMSLPPPGSYVVTVGDERVQVVAEALAGVLPAGAVVRGVA
jgi:hypothetical protein